MIIIMYYLLRAFGRTARAKALTRFSAYRVFYWAYNVLNYWSTPAHCRPSKEGLAFIGNCGLFLCYNISAWFIYTATPCVYLLWVRLIEAHCRQPKGCLAFFHIPWTLLVLQHAELLIYTLRVRLFVGEKICITKPISEMYAQKNTWGVSGSASVSGTKILQRLMSPNDTTSGVGGQEI